MPVRCVVGEREVFWVFGGGIHDGWGCLSKCFHGSTCFDPRLTLTYTTSRQTSSHLVSLLNFESVDTFMMSAAHAMPTLPPMSLGKESCAYPRPGSVDELHRARVRPRYSTHNYLQVHRDTYLQGETVACRGVSVFVFMWELDIVMKLWFKKTIRSSLYGHLESPCPPKH